MDWVGIDNQASIAVLVASFLISAILESRWPARPLTESTERRWGTHGLLFLCSIVPATLLMRVSPLVVALASVNNSWGVLNREWMPGWVRIAAAILLLDAFHYFAHRFFHSFEVLWRVHEVHHSDHDYDISTSFRFHPVEVMATQGLYLGVIFLMAPPVVAVFFAGLHTSLLNAFVHTNVSLPANLERWMRLVFITPDVHRIHHSTDFQDQNRNFGQTFVFWDRLFGSYRDNPSSPDTGVEGVTQTGVLEMLAGPFRRRAQ